MTVTGDASDDDADLRLPEYKQEKTAQEAMSRANDAYNRADDAYELAEDAMEAAQAAGGGDTEVLVFASSGGTAYTGTCGISTISLYLGDVKVQHQEFNVARINIKPQSVIVPKPTGMPVTGGMTSYPNFLLRLKGTASATTSPTVDVIFSILVYWEWDSTAGEFMLRQVDPVSGIHFDSIDGTTTTIHSGSVFHNFGKALFTYETRTMAYYKADGTTESKQIKRWKLAA